MPEADCMRNQTRRDEISKLLAMREREGLTYQELSERCGLAAATLSWWSWRLRRESRSGFAEVVVQEGPGSEEGTGGVRLQLCCDVLVEVSPDFDADTLGRVIDVVRARC